MNKGIKPFPIIDLHCDLLLYLVKTPGAGLYETKGIGVTLPYLTRGNVKHQVLAIYVPTGPGSVALAQQEVAAYKVLLTEEAFYPITKSEDAAQVPASDRIGVTAAIENASGLCEEDEKLDLAFQRLEEMLNTCGHLFYIGFTHHHENRFGGGNKAQNVGLKADGETLLQYLHGKRIAR